MEPSLVIVKKMKRFLIGEFAESRKVESHFPPTPTPDRPEGIHGLITTLN